MNREENNWTWWPDVSYIGLSFRYFQTLHWQISGLVKDRTNFKLTSAGNTDIYKNNYPFLHSRKQFKMNFQVQRSLEKTNKRDKRFSPMFFLRTEFCSFLRWGFYQKRYLALFLVKHNSLRKKDEAVVLSRLNVLIFKSLLLTGLTWNHIAYPLLLSGFLSTRMLLLMENMQRNSGWGVSNIKRVTLIRPGLRQKVKESQF